MMIIRIVSVLLLLLGIHAKAQDIIYEKSDSIAIERILKKHSTIEYSNQGELTVAVAREFIGNKYVAGTLDKEESEPLYISCSKLDCTTFVELVLAIAKTVNEGSCQFCDVCSNLETIRYRNGKNNGYTSRLHYITWWIADSAKTGIIEDVTPQISQEKQALNLNFMSTHPSSYPMLANNQELTIQIELQEIPYRNIEVNYIPKEKLAYTGHENIKTGDIIAITTSVPGLDVTHMGIAYYNNNTLCLLHASSGKGAVIGDTTPLRDYLMNNKRHTGIRVFRATF